MFAMAAVPLLMSAVLSPERHLLQARSESVPERVIEFWRINWRTGKQANGRGFNEYTRDARMMPAGEWTVSSLDDHSTGGNVAGNLPNGIAEESKQPHFVLSRQLRNTLGFNASTIFAALPQVWAKAVQQADPDFISYPLQPCSFGSASSQKITEEVPITRTQVH
jgi:hypothetical protein